MSEEEKKEESQEDQAEAKKESKMGEGKKVLVVDDDPSTQELFKGILEKEGFQVLIRDNGQQGLAMAAEERPELIIADVLMPEMDGYNFFKELKNNPQTKPIKILISSVRKNMEDTFLALGAEGFVPKPIDTGSLLKKIGELSLVPIPEVSGDQSEDTGDAPEKQSEEKKE